MANHDLYLLGPYEPNNLGLDHCSLEFCRDLCGFFGGKEISLIELMVNWWFGLVARDSNRGAPK